MGFEPRIDERNDLAEFLRTRRARVQPGDVGLSAGGRRRSPGLRREEVAQLAGIGVAWYTWLEQGRGVQPSERAIEGVARALRLDSVERTHLFRLARGAPPRTLSPIIALPNTVQAVIDAMSPWPAYIRSARWDILAWNEAAALFFGDYAYVPLPHRNIAWLTFCDPSYRALLADWEGDARQITAALRSDQAAAVSDPAFAELVAELELLSPQFKRWWGRHDVLGCSTGSRRYSHPRAGTVELDYMAFGVEGLPGCKLVTHTSDRAETRNALSSLGPRTV